MGKFLAIAILAAIIIIGIVVASIMGFRTVEPGQIGILTVFGKADPVELEQGMHIINPFTSQIIIQDISVLKAEAKASAASKDLQDVSTVVALNYHIDPTNASELYQKFRGHHEEIYIAPAIQETVKQITAKFNAAELITKRELVKQEIQSSIDKRLEPYNIKIDALSITQFNFSPDFNKAIEDKVKAEQILKRIAIEAQQKITAAEGQKNSTILVSEGQAQSIKNIENAIANSPNYLQWFEIDKWNGVVPRVQAGDSSNGISLILPQEMLTNTTK